MRKLRGIPSAKQRARTTESREDAVRSRLDSKPAIDHLKTVPINYEQLQEIIHRRHQLGLSQADLADLVGVHAMTISKFESGGPLAASAFIALCHVLDLAPHITITVKLLESEG